MDIENMSSDSKILIFVVIVFIFVIWWYMSMSAPASTAPTSTSQPCGQCSAGSKFVPAPMVSQYSLDGTTNLEYDTGPFASGDQYAVRYST